MSANVLSSIARAGVGATIALLAAGMLPDDTLAGVPVAAATLGTAVAAAPLASLSGRKGRRPGLSTGFVIGAAGGLLGFVAGQYGLFWPLVLASVLFGVGQASMLQSRYAAADLADDTRRARDISLVVWVGTVGAVAGSAIAIWVNRMGVSVGLGDWVGPMALGFVGYGMCWGVIAIFLRPDPLVASGGVDPTARTGNGVATLSRSWVAVKSDTLARLALWSMAFSQMAMVAVMVMTPLHMKDHGHAELSPLVIAVHVLGMFGLAPLVGRWADRRGRLATIRHGAVILGLGTVLSVIAGYVPALIFIGLFLLGLGWNFAFVAGSALLTESLDPEHRVGAQGMSDVVMSSLGAFAALGSGFVKEGVGFHWLANFATVAAALILVMAISVSRTRPQQAQAG